MNNRSAAMQGAMHDLKTGDLLGYHKNMFEAATGFDPGKLGMLNMASSFGAMNPATALSHERGQWLDSWRQRNLPYSTYLIYLGRNR